MSTDEDKEVAKEPATLPSKSSTKEDDEPSKQSNEEKKLVVVKPSKTEYKASLTSHLP